MTHFILVLLVNTAKSFTMSNWYISKEGKICEEIYTLELKGVIFMFAGKCKNGELIFKQENIK